MEDKQLTTRQSLDLIARMIATTRRNFNDRGGAMFLIWGYTIFFVSPATLLYMAPFGIHWAPWLWCVIPLIGGVLTWLHRRKHPKQITTYLDKAVSYVWITFAAACLVCVVLDIYLPMRVLTTPPAEFRYIKLPTLFILVVLGSMATAITGLVIKYRPVAIGGFVGLALSFLMVIYKDEPMRFLILPVILLLVSIIPGHLLNAACKRERVAAEASSASAAKNGRAE